MGRWKYVVFAIWMVTLLRFIVVQTQKTEETLVWEISSVQEEGDWQISRSGEYKRILSFSSAKELLISLAEQFGVVSEGEVTLVNKENGSVTRYQKQGTNWELVIEYTVIKGETIWENAQSYLSVSFSMKGEKGETIIEDSEAYRKILDEWCDKKEVTGQTAMLYTFRRNEVLTQKEQEEWCRQVLASCKGQEITADNSGNMYLLYGYSDCFDTYMKVNGEKVNINLGVFVQEEECTIMQVGIPYIPF